MEWRHVVERLQQVSLEEPGLPAKSLDAGDVLRDVPHVLQGDAAAGQSVSDVPQAKLLTQDLAIRVVVIDGGFVVPVGEEALGGVDGLRNGHETTWPFGAAVAGQR